MKPAIASPSAISGVLARLRCCAARGLAHRVQWHLHRYVALCVVLSSMAMAVRANSLPDPVSVSGEVADDTRASGALRQRLLHRFTQDVADFLTLDLITSTTLSLDGRILDPIEMQFAHAQYLKSYPTNDARTTRGLMMFRMEQALTMLTAERAEREGMTQDPDFIRLREAVLTRLEAEHYIRSRLLRDIAISEADIAQFYQSNPTRFSRPEMVELQIILTTTEQEARDALTELSQGVPFATVAERRSVHASRLRGGRLNPIPRGTLDEAVEAVVFSLDDGERSGVITSTSGFYVVERIATREATVTPLERARPEIYQLLYEQRRVEILDRFYHDLAVHTRIDLLAPLPPPPDAPAPLEASPQPDADASDVVGSDVAAPVAGDADDAAASSPSPEADAPGPDAP